MEQLDTDNYNLEEYIERNRRWTDKAMSQLSFLNNLLLTLGLGFISLAYDKIKDTKIVFDIKTIDYSLTCYIISLILIGISIFIGLFIAHNRSVNFRITRHINLVRLWAFKYSQKKLSISSTDTESFWKRISWQFKYCIDFPRISIENCKSLKETDDKNLYETFQKLRIIGHNLGVSTWRRTNWQIFLFTLGLLLYFIAIFIN
ncbi:hypothetical protein SAMN05444274_1272 [Mariniphaga anaerophila]|uniref:Uncharacterized protein n=1 Tax=Mariniphaga anaerophila TaxID=1484053 RepID=A0A1M5GMI6_9BACT|nr:hypothetical protein [Mariniphaga anaerophila]SHG04955.1 hypothetical protein SAMN05444274_1272 [Mariniphaga anaerophila]